MISFTLMISTETPISQLSDLLVTVCHQRLRCKQDVPSADSEPRRLRCQGSAVPGGERPRGTMLCRETSSPVTHEKLHSFIKSVQELFIQTSTATTFTKVLAFVSILLSAAAPEMSGHDSTCTTINS